ncbi:UNVERIFIED_ORG: cbb3-type cytochrome oxidase subunit 3 [Paraburkholderia sediminicola]|nr:cbb3-type cytochrome oxidase subunit 3 [Paraburkholderia sediminicola]
MDISSALETFTIALALFCVALVPFAIGRDPGLARRIVRMDSLPRARWPNLLTRAGIACLLVSFALLLVGCYYIIAGAGY